ncbi:MAG: hypothetical protein IJ593_02900 [Lachnospiraceae bacterium]|nr:hypothetical protein [Lachnospiraceae bacterium]
MKIETFIKPISDTVRISVYGPDDLLKGCYTKLVYTGVKAEMPNYIKSREIKFVDIIGDYGGSALRIASN